jgi:hypothetical protein
MPLLITAHAVQRYCERVEPGSSAQTANAAIAEIAATGRRRARPRRWTRIAGCRPGAVYVYSHCHPGVCLVMRREAVVTVFSRRACVEWRQPEWTLRSGPEVAAA